MLKLTLLILLLGALAGFINKRLSYFLTFLGSVLAFIVGFEVKILSKTFALKLPFLGSVIGLQVDKLSGLFLMIASISWIAVSLFSLDFGQNYRKRMSIFINLTILGMFLVLTALDFIMFLVGWEVMTIFAYLLITESKGAFKEAFKFLAFSELSTLSLIVGFLALFNSEHSLQLIGIHSSSVCFLFFVSFAFIVKMGIFPTHTWLKEAHSKAPSNASALLSAPITLMGVYGLTRVISITGYTHIWGIIAIILGSLTAFYGAALAAASKELKVLPAYSTVENNGMILAALGLAALAYHFSVKSTLYQFAFLTAIMLSITHTIAKTLLFLSIGEAKEKLHEENIDAVRGIHKSVGKIPALGIVFSGLSFSAFPMLLGYVAEWMLLESIFQSYQFSSILDRIVSVSGGVLLSLAMGFASFSMIKLIGYSALGYHHEKKAYKMPSFFMHFSEIFLMFLILALSFFTSCLFLNLGYPQFVIGALGVPKGWLLASAKPVFGVISPAFLVIVIGVLFIVPFFVYLKNLRKTKRVVSFNGGLLLKEDEYFTANAFSFTIEYILRFIYSTKEVITENSAYVWVHDRVESLYDFIADLTGSVAYRLSKLIMNGKTHWYVFYILALFLVVFIIFGT